MAERVTEDGMVPDRSAAWLVIALASFYSELTQDSHHFGKVSKLKIPV
jgi:hypothetical protein